MIAVCVLHNGEAILAGVAPNLQYALLLACMCPRGRTWIELLSDAAVEQIQSGRIGIVQ